MNSYFTPKTPEPRMSAFDIALRAMMCMIAVLIIGLGIWTFIDALDKEPAVGSLVTSGDRTPTTNHTVAQSLPE